MSIPKMVLELAEKAKEAAHTLPLLSTGQKNQCLLTMAEALGKKTKIILKENKKDLDLADQAGPAPGFFGSIAAHRKNLGRNGSGVAGSGSTARSGGRGYRPVDSAQRIAGGADAHPFRGHRFYL